MACIVGSPSRPLRAIVALGLESLAYSLKHFATALGVGDEVRRAVNRIEREAEERSRDDDDDDEPEPERDWDDSDESPRFNIDDMFDGLLYDIEAVDAEATAQK